MMLNNSRVIPSKIRTKLLDREKESLELKKKYNDKVVKFRCNYSSTQLQVMLARGWHKVILSGFRECANIYAIFVNSYKEGQYFSIKRDSKRVSNVLKGITRWRHGISHRVRSGRKDQSVGGSVHQISAISSHFRWKMDRVFFSFLERSFFWRYLRIAINLGSN